jgi:hypothetical protein
LQPTSSTDLPLSAGKYNAISFSKERESPACQGKDWYVTLHFLCVAGIDFRPNVTAMPRLLLAAHACSLYIRCLQAKPPEEPEYTFFRVKVQTGASIGFARAARHGHGQRNRGHGHLLVVPNSLRAMCTYSNTGKLFSLFRSRSKKYNQLKGHETHHAHPFLGWAFSGIIGGVRQGICQFI